MNNIKMFRGRLSHESVKSTRQDRKISIVRAFNGVLCCGIGVGEISKFVFLHVKYLQGSHQILNSEDRFSVR